jgi:hypothetical protein
VIEIIRRPQVPPHSGAEPYWDTRANLVERLKGAASWDTGTEREFTMGEDALGLNRAQKEFRPGSRFIFLFDHWSNGKPYLEACGAVPFNGPNLALVRIGIDQDYLASNSKR